MFVWCPRLFSQSAGASAKPQGQTLSESSEWLSAANRWQLTAIDFSSQSDTATPELRAKRNAYLQPHLEVAREWREPTNLPPGAVSSWSPGAVVGDVPELSAPAHAIWVIAKFESFHVFALDPQYRLIHTEINLRVTQIVKQPSSLSLAVGSLLDCDIIGGRIKKPDGSVASFSVLPSRHSYQPGGTYLMVVTYDPSTEYFDMDNWWDLSSGKVVPGTLVEIGRAAKGNSKLNGLTTVQAVQYLDSVLPDSN
jgi:hypothetical protein